MDEVPTAATLDVKGRGEVHGSGRTNTRSSGPAGGHGGDHEPGWRGRFKVFVAVYGKVDVAVEEGLFDFFGEEPLAFHLVKADILDLVSVRLEHHDVHGAPRACRRSRTWCACHNARSLPRVPMRM